MRLARATTLGLLALLSACGGGGGSVPTVTIEIIADPALDGFVRSDGAAYPVGSGPAIGDVDASLPGSGHRVFYSFPLASIPPGKTIVSVVLQIRQRLVVGDPYATHGVAVLDHLDYGATLDGGDYALAAFAPAFAVASADATVGNKSIDVTFPVVADLAAARPNSQYRVRFSVLDSDNDGAHDAAAYEDAVLSGSSPAGSEPKLIVTYVP